MANLKNNIASLQALISIAGSLPMENEHLDELNAANGGTNATAIGAAVDNTKAHASSQEAMIAHIVEALEGKMVEGSGPEYPYVIQATPTISVSSDGLITASATQEGGIVSAGTKTGTKQMTTKAATTITPTKSSQTAVAKNVYTTGVVTVDPISDIYMEKNFTVVGGTTQPSNPAENTIWINTNTMITSYGFGQGLTVEFINNATNGAVWIITGNNTKSAMTMSKDEDIWICPMNAYQMVNGSFTSKPVRAYINGAWINPSVQILFDDGDQCTDVTGGWTNSGWSVSSVPSHDYWTSFEIGNEYLATSASINGYARRGGYLGTANKISLNGYTKIRIKGVYTGPHENWRIAHYIGLSSSKMASNQPLASLYFNDSNDLGEFDKVISIPSGLTEAYIFMLSYICDYVEQVQLSGSIRITEVTLE